MNRRLGDDVSLNTLVHDEEAGEVQDWLADPASSDPSIAILAPSSETSNKRHERRQVPSMAIV
jgi:hypothetical protein